MAWKIIFIGIVLQILIGIVFLLNVPKNELVGAFSFSVVGIVLIFGSLIGVLPLLLLLFNQTKKIGALVSILLGILGIIFRFGLIVGISLIIAGIVTFIKKKK